MGAFVLKYHRILFEKGGAENLLVFLANPAVKLFYSNCMKSMGQQDGNWEECLELRLREP